MAQRFSDAPRPTSEDLWRALAYAVLLAWGVVYLVYPPPPLPSVLEFTTRLLWMIPTSLGFLLALIGALFRVDIKAELPGLIVMLPGPTFFGVTQLWLIFHPALTNPQDPSSRYALALYAFTPALLIMPRIVSLMNERKRLRRVAQAQAEQLALMTEAERAQPGAGVVFTMSTPVVEKKRGGRH